jgi:hypothetical protein
MPVRRDDKGRFIKGTCGGPGRPPKKVEETYLDRFRDAVSPDEFFKATVAVLKEAQAGDITAWKELAKYALGLPVVKAELDVRQRSLSAELQVMIDAAYGDDEEIIESGS